jgi:hypothetical protein
MDAIQSESIEIYRETKLVSIEFHQGQTRRVIFLTRFKDGRKWDDGILEKGEKCHVGYSR